MQPRPSLPQLVVVWIVLAALAAVFIPQGGRTEASRAVRSAPPAPPVASPAPMDAVTAAPHVTPTPHTMAVAIRPTDPPPTPAPSTVPTASPPRTPVITENSYVSDRLQISIETVTREDLTFFVCDIRLADAEQLRTAFANEERAFTSRAYTSEISRENGAVLACNADYVGFRGDGTIIRNGEVLRDQPSGLDLLVVDRDGDLRVIRGGKPSARELAEAGVWQTLSFGPALVVDGVAQTEFPYRLVSDQYKEPRTAIGQAGPLRYIVIVADGRQDDYSEGMKFDELAREFAARGCSTAYNLDGGGSTTLVFDGRVFNRPSGSGERAVGDILYFVP